MQTAVRPAELRLVYGGDTLVVRPRNATAGDPIFCRQWDIGAPDMRYTNVARPGADGVDIGPGFLGNRTVTLDLQIQGGPDPDTKIVHDAYWYADKLIAMAHPSATPWLRISREAPNNWWRMALRGNPWTISFAQRAAALLELQLTFTCPSGVLESDPPRGFTTPDPGGIPDNQLSFPAAFPAYFGLPQGVAWPSVTFEVGGTSWVAPDLYINGPVADPEVRTDTGERFRFSGLTLAVNQTVQVSMETGAVRLTDASTGVVADDMAAFNTVDWNASTFWRWKPGLHTLYYLANSGRATVQFRERRLTI
jgi:hypothetical protein